MVPGWGRIQGMGYDYGAERERIFSEDGVATLLAIREEVRELLEQAGAFQAEKAWRAAMGDTWLKLACMDYLEERGEILRLQAIGACERENEIYTWGLG